MANPSDASETSDLSLSQNLENDFQRAQDYFDLQQMASLMDGALPFEACLYHQVIPLSVDASRLNLGMVNPDDSLAIDYVKRQIAYIEYTLVKWPITSDWHRETLSKYLSYQSKADEKPNNNSQAGPAAGPKTHPSKPSALTPAEEATFIVDSPTTILNTWDSYAPPIQHRDDEVLPDLMDKAHSPTTANFQQPSTPPQTTILHQNQSQAREALPEQTVSCQENMNQKQAGSLEQSTAPPQQAPPSTQVTPPQQGASPRNNASPQNPALKTNPRKNPLTLELPPESVPACFSDLRNLSYKRLTRALLNRVLQEGIGRLYFERREHVGRILWSKDGIVQAAINDLSLPLFQSVINEFKQLTHFPLSKDSKTKQVEIERTYRQERIILKFRLIGGTYGEEATLQVLRGAALKLYQKQQIDRLGQNALTVAHRLHSQIEQIRERSRQTNSIEGTSSKTLTTLSHLLKDMDSEINVLMRNQP